MALLSLVRWPVRRQHISGETGTRGRGRAGIAAATLGALLTMHLCIGFAADTRVSTSDDPVALLARIQQAARKLDYAGVFVYSQGEFTQSSRIVHMLDGTGERERLEVLDGQPREYLRHNDDVQCLMPERKTVRLERRRGDRFPGLLLGDPAGLANHYDIRADEKVHRVAGRQCRLILIEPRDGLRYGYRLCADTETNLLVKAQTITANKAVVEQVIFTSLRIGAGIQSDALKSPWETRDWEVQHTDMTPVDLTAKGWRVPAPPGFVSVMQVGRKMKRGGVSQMVLSDGLAAISVFIEPYDAQMHGQRPEGGERQGAINVFGTRIANFWLTALGEVPMETLRQVAESTEYVPLPAP